MGFDQSLRQIMQRLPKQRRTGLFSATMTDGLTELMKAGLRYPTRVVVKVEDRRTRRIQRTPSALTIQYAFCGEEEKFRRLVQLLWEYRDRKVIVYFCTCPAVDYFQVVKIQLFLCYTDSLYGDFLVILL